MLSFVGEEHALKARQWQPPARIVYALHVTCIDPILPRVHMLLCERE